MRIMIFFAALLFCADLVADVELPSVYADHMVLQRDLPVQVRGWAKPGSEISVAIGAQTRTASAAAGGRWSVTLEPMKAGGPYDLKVSGDGPVSH